MSVRNNRRGVIILARTLFIVISLLCVVPGAWADGHTSSWVDRYVGGLLAALKEISPSNHQISRWNKKKMMLAGGTVAGIGIAGFAGWYLLRPRAPVKKRNGLPQNATLVELLEDAKNILEEQGKIMEDELGKEFRQLTSDSSSHTPEQRRVALAEYKKSLVQRDRYKSKINALNTEIQEAKSKYKSN